MAGKKSTLSTTEPALAGLQVQTSTYGLAVPRVWGRTRLAGNLIWYGDFKAIPHTETTESGGKGGGGTRQERTSYTYEAAVAMGLCAGPINGILSAWKGKQRYGGATVSSSTRTLLHVVPVPSGGVITVPSAGIFAANVSVQEVDYEDPAYGSGTLVEGVDYTVSAGTYTFSGWDGISVRIVYQVHDAASSYSALGQLGLNLATGTIGQPTWSYLSSSHPSEAIGYSGLAYVYASGYELNSSAQVENHTFEVSTPSEFSASIPDADMSRVVREFLIDGVAGVQWPEALLGDTTAFQNYVRAFSLFMSPALEEQRAAADILKDWLRFTNTGVCWSARKLKFVPLGDEAKTANGATYTPVTTPVYDLVPDDFVTDDGDEPRIKVAPRANEDAYNHIRVEYRNRANDYNVEVISAKDLAHIEQYGERTMEVVKAHDVKTPELASFIAQMLLQRQMSVWNTYVFRLPWTKGRLEPLDLVTLTDPDLYLDRVPVRLTRVTEVDDDAFDVEAEDAPIGSASAPLYGTQAGSGFAPDYNAAPGNALAPVIIEAPGSATTTGLGLLIATAGSNAMWGGCDVWASYDGSNYQRIGTVRGGARYGTLGASISDAASSAAVVINGGQLLSGSAADAVALATLCYLGGSSPEYVAYQSATLTSANHYTLGSLVRGAHGVPASAHSAGADFVRVDGAVVSSGALDLSLIGTTVHIKLTSFNVFGGGQQSLADVSPYTYTINGSFVLPELGGFGLQATAQQFTFDGSNVAKPTAQTITFKLSTGGAPGTPTWLATRYDATGTIIDTITLGGSGSTRTLPVADFGAAAYCVVMASLGSVSDQITIHRTRDGADAITGYLTNEACTVSTAADGSGGSYTGAGGAFKVFKGVTPVTTGVTYSVQSSSGISGMSVDSSGVYSLTGTTADVGTASLRAVYAGVTIDKVYTISRSKTGSRGFDGDPGTQSAQAFLWQWSSSTPGDPNGSSTWTWATAAHSGYTGGNGWSTSVPTNPGTAGLKLWVASKGVVATATASSTTVSWASGFTVAVYSANGSSGAPGLQAGEAKVYQWAATIPAGPTGAATYTWGSGGFGSAPSGWSLTPGTSPSVGYTLWAATVRVQDSASNSTTAFNWTSASITAAGYAGSNGQQGASARYAYQRISGNPTPVGGTVNHSGDGVPTSSESNSVWGLNVSWSTSDPNPSSTNTLYQTDGIYDPATGNTVWSTPYISSLKVGSLSAITANMGALNVDSVLTMGSGGMINQGSFSGFAWPSSGTGFHLGPLGLLMGNYVTGGFVEINADGSYFDLGKNGGPRMTWQASGGGSLSLSGASLSASVITGGILRTASSGTRVEVTGSTNDLRFWDSSNLAVYIGTGGSIYSYAAFGSVNSWAGSRTGVYAESYSGLAFVGVSAQGSGASFAGGTGGSYNGHGVIATGNGTGHGVNASNGSASTTGNAVYGKTFNLGAAIYGDATYTGGIAVYADGKLYASGAFGCNGKTPQPAAASGGTLAGVIAALVACGILSS